MLVFTSGDPLQKVQFSTDSPGYQPFLNSLDFVFYDYTPGLPQLLLLFEQNFLKIFRVSFIVRTMFHIEKFVLMHLQVVKS